MQINKSRPGIRRLQKGASIIEILIASGIVVFSALALAVVFEPLGASRARAAYISTISTIESALTTSLLNEALYQDPSLRTALKSASLPSNFKYEVKGDVSGVEFDFDIRPTLQGTADLPVLLNSRTLQPCNEFPSPQCDLRINLKVSFLGTQVMFAYKFENNGRFGSALLSYRGSGSKKANETWDNAQDFSLPLPYEYLYDNLLLGCPTDSVGVRGISRVGSKVECIAQPQQTCPNGTLPKSVMYNDETKSVELVCSAPVQQASCPAKYNFESIDIASLDPAKTKQAVCVYYMKKEGSGPSVGPAPTIPSTPLCPDDYVSTSSCSLANVVKSNGQCPDYCTNWISVIDYNPLGVPIGSHMECTNWVTPPPNPPIEGSCSANNSGKNAGASVHSPSQSCGATWTADVILHPHCTLNLPEYSSAN